MLQIEERRLREIAHSFSLSILGLSDLAPLDDAANSLKDWQNKGYAADMAFMKRPLELLSRPQELCPAACSIMAFCVNYDRGERLSLAPGHGRVARYAWGRDYHKVLRRQLQALVRAVEDELGEKLEFRVFSDSVPLLERAIAAKAGLGFIGKNSMLIRYKSGSFFFISEILWNLKIVKSQNKPILHIQDNNCGSCTLCKDQCPTEAIVDDYKIDARKCISYLTIEKRDALSEWERRALGEWVFGCDICQEVCPFNYQTLNRKDKADLIDLSGQAGVGPQLNLSQALQIRNDDRFIATFQGTPLMRAKRVGLLRNASVVAANTRSEELTPHLVACVREDSSAIVRQHALWALFNLERDCNSVGRNFIKSLLEESLRDTDLGVSGEAFSLLENYT